MRKMQQVQYVPKTVSNLHLNNGNVHTNSRGVGRSIEARLAMRVFLQIPTVHENGVYHR